MPDTTPMPAANLKIQLVSNNTPAPTGTISGTVFNDLNRDGVNDGADSGIQGDTVTLSQGNTTVASTKTDANGTYSVPDLPLGSYTVSFATPNGGTPTTPTTVQNVTVNANSTSTVDAGFYAPSTSTSTISIDTPIAGDNVINAAEVAAGVTISGTSSVGSGQFVVVVFRTASNPSLGNFGTYTTSGGAWSVTVPPNFASFLTPPSDGAYTVTADVSDSFGNRAPTASQAISFDETAPKSPAAPADAGVANGYVNAANDTAAQTLTGTAEKGSTVAIFDGATKVATVAADAVTGAWSYKIGALAEASTHSYTVTATDAAGNTSSPSAALTFTVDTTAPTLTSFVANGASLTNAASVSYTVTFSEAVTGVDASAFALDASGTDTAATIAGVTPVQGNNGTSYIVTVKTGGAGHDGTITLDLTGAKIKDLAGNGYSGGVFQPQTTYAAGSNPLSVAIGDVNGDGKADLVTANNGSNTVSVLLGKGDGTFMPAATYATGSYPASVAIGDVNGDGEPDLVVANERSNNVSVLLGKGDGTFMPEATYSTGPAGNYPASVAIGDVNGDGRPDLVTADVTYGSVSVLLGKGDGTFMPAATYAIGAYPNSVAIGDLNGDGRPDLVTANFNTNTVSVMLGKGDGTFGAQATYATGSDPGSVVIGDVNGDGRPDLVTANAFGNNVSVLLGKSDGTFSAQATYATGFEPYSVAIGDVNGDGKPDLVVPNITSSTMSVLLGNGDGTFGAPAPHQTGSGPAFVAIGDVNGDGRPDVVSANSGPPGTVSVLLNSPQTVASPIFTIDKTPPVVQSLTETPSSGDLDAGKSVTLTLTASEAVAVTGKPTLTLNDGGIATYDAQASAALNDPTKLVFDYTVGAGDTSVAALAATTLNLAGSATIQDLAGNAAVLTLPASQTGPRIDTVAPTIAALTETPSSGDLDAGKSVTLTLTASEAVAVTGTPTLTLNDGGIATYDAAASAALKDPTQLVFDYTVGSGDRSVASLAATTLNLIGGAAIQDLAGNAAILTLPASQTGPQIDTVAPTIAITTPIAGDNAVNKAEAAAGIAIAGTTSGTEDGQTVTVKLVNAADTVVDTYTTAVTSGAWSVNVSSTDATGLADGAYTVTADVSDKAGNPATEVTKPLTVDETAPTIAITTPIAGDNVVNKAEAAAGVTIAGTTTGAEDGRTVTVTLVNAAKDVVATETGTVANGGWSTTVPSSLNLGDGSYTVKANVSDEAGNAAVEATTPITVDETAPVITVITLERPSYKFGDTVTATIQFSAGADGNGDYTLGAGSTIDGMALTVGSYDSTNNTLTATFDVDSTTTEVTAGNVAANVVVDDAAGNASAPGPSVIANETIDRTPPLLATAAVNGNTLVLTYAETGSGVAAGTVPLKSDYLVLAGTAADAVTSVAVDAKTKTVTLTLATAVASSDTVTLSYTPNITPGDPVLQDAVGNLAAGLNAQPVKNNTPAPAGGGGGGGGSPTPAAGLGGGIVVTTPPANNTPVSAVTPPDIAFDPTVLIFGRTVTLTGSASAGTTGVAIFEGSTGLGAATLNPDGTWSFDFANGPGFHTGIAAVATDSQGLVTTAPSYYDLTTGIRGEPYRTVQDSYDPGTYGFEGSTYFKRSGTIYLQNNYAPLSDGGSSYNYTSGSFFRDKVYSSFVDSYDADGVVTTHVENNRDGSHYVEIDAASQRVVALGADTFNDFASNTRFVFDHGVGQETIQGFQVAGAGHDMVSLPNSDASRLANILAHATGDGQGDTTIKIGQGDTITFAGVSVAQLQKHAGDFVFHA